VRYFKQSDHSSTIWDFYINSIEILSDFAHLVKKREEGFFKFYLKQHLYLRNSTILICKSNTN